MAAVELLSGEWAGHYEQMNGLYPQRLRLELADGVARGGGIDQVGTFSVEGDYRTEGSTVRIGWIKTYEGAHSVLYLGILQPDGSIGGDWRLEGGWRGAFRIAPVPARDGEVL